MSKNQFSKVESVAEFKDAVDNHFIPLLQATLQQRVGCTWTHTKVCMLQYLEPMSNGMAQQVTKTIYYDEANKRAEYMDGAMHQSPPVELN